MGGWDAGLLPDAAALRYAGGMLRESDTPPTACDSLVALGAATADGVTRLAKNSDRPANEPQPLVQIPRQSHAKGARVRCQYLEIPQVAETARVIGSQPFWLWGFEHGLNEHGVAIGNQTIFTRDTPSDTGLLGMDLVRLGLERGRTAREAVDVIIGLADRYGQGGSGYFDKHWPYHSSFLVADPEQALLLETSDRRWALRRVHDVASASNHVTIGRDWDELSPDAIPHAVAHGWWSAPSMERFDFAAAYRDSSVVPEQVSSGRLRRSGELLRARRGAISSRTLIAALRDHYDGPVFRPGRTPDDERFFCICRHDPLDVTAASMVAELRHDGLLRYWAGLGSPCVGPFLPLYVDGDIPSELAVAGEATTSDSPWWRFRRLLELVERDFARWGPEVRSFWDPFEEEVERRAAEAEREALDYRAAGDEAACRGRLTQLMAETLRVTRDRLEDLIGRLESA